jgi:hypothetical protein
MTELIIPTVAYRPTGTERPRAWKWHLRKRDGIKRVQTICGLTLEDVESALIADIPTGELCRQCLGAMKEK